MKMNKAIEITRTIIRSHLNGTLGKFDSIIYSGPSGIGKSRGLAQLAKEELTAKFGTEEGKYLFVPIGTHDDITGIQGMAVPGDSYVQFQRPEAFKDFFEDETSPKILILDEVNRVADDKMLNGIQSLLDCGDREELGLKNCLVLGTQNPVTTDYHGTSEADKAFESRTMFLEVDAINRADIWDAASKHCWDDAIVDGIDYIVDESSESMDIHNLEFRQLHRVNTFLNMGITDQEIIEAALHKNVILATAIIQAKKGTLIKAVPYAELKQKITSGEHLSLLTITLSIRKEIRKMLDRGANVETRTKFYKDLSSLLLKVPTSVLAETVSRIRHVDDIAIDALASNKELQTRVIEKLGR